METVPLAADESQSSLPVQAWCWLAVACLFCMPLAIEVPVFGVGKRTISITPFDPMIWTCGGLLGLAFVLRRFGVGGDLRDTLREYLLLLWPCLMLLAAGGVSLLFGSHAGEISKALAGKTVFQAVEYLVVTPIVFHVLLRRREWRARALWGLTAGILVCALSISWRSPLSQVWVGEIHPHRVGGFLGNRNTYGIFMALALPLLVGWSGLWQRRRAGQGVPLLLLVPGLLLPCLVAYPMLALGPLVALLLGVSIAHAAGHRAGALFGLVLVAWVAWGAEGPVERVARARALVDSVQSYRVDRSADAAVAPTRPTVRYMRWAANLNMVRANPLFGVGWGGYQGASKQYYGAIPRPPGTTGVDALWDLESDEPFSFSWFMVTACEMGLLGCAALLLWLAEMVARCCRVEGKRPFAWNGILGALVALLIAGVWTSPMVRGAGPLLGLLTAMTGVLGEPIRDKEGSPDA